MLAFGSHAPIPERPADGDACATVAATAHGDADPPFADVTATNTCDGIIHCSILGYTGLSSGRISSFKDDVVLAVGETHETKIFTHRPDVRYATAVCERD